MCVLRCRRRLKLYRKPLLQTGQRCSPASPIIRPTTPALETTVPLPLVVLSSSLEVPTEKLTGRSSSVADTKLRPSPLRDRFVILVSAFPGFFLREDPRIKPGAGGGCWTRSECQNRLCWVSSSELEKPVMQCSQKFWLFPLLSTVCRVVQLPAWLLGV